MKQVEVKKYRKIYSDEDIEKFISASFDQLRSDTDVYNKIKELGVKTSQVRDYLSLFLDFQEDFNCCKNCKGLEFCPKQRKHMKMTLKIDGSIVDRQLTLCDYAIEKMNLDKQYIYSDFPEKWKNHKLQDLKPLKVRTNIINALTDILERKNSNWIYLTSKDANGKSFILVSFLNTIVSLNRGPVACIDCSFRINELKDESISNKDDFNVDLEKLCNVPVLMFDNFGEGYKSDYALDAIIMPILNERKRRGLLTLFASVYSIDEVAQLYSGQSKNKDSINLIRRRISKLLREVCEDEMVLEGIPVYKKSTN